MMNKAVVFPEIRTSRDCQPYVY